MRTPRIDVSIKRGALLGSAFFRSMRAEEIDEIVEVLLGQIKMRHLMPSFDAGRLVLDPVLQCLTGAIGVLVAAIAQPDISQFRCKTRPFPEQRMAIKAGALFPNTLPTRR